MSFTGRQALFTDNRGAKPPGEAKKQAEEKGNRELKKLYLSRKSERIRKKLCKIYKRFDELNNLQDVFLGKIVMDNL